MHCPWCSNPEGMNCEGHAKSRTVKEILKEVLSCVPMFFDGGGVTFTGGEASLQFQELKELLEHLKQCGIHTAIETNGTHVKLREYVRLIDYWMIDFKHPDSKKLKEITGIGNEQIKQNILQITSEKEVHIRIPFIHGFNDDADSLDGFLTYFSMLQDQKARFDVEILAYHEYGKEKWLREGKEYAVADGFVSDESVRTFEQAFKNLGIKVIHT